MRNKKFWKAIGAYLRSHVQWTLLLPKASPFALTFNTIGSLVGNFDDIVDEGVAEDMKDE